MNTVVEMSDFIELYSIPYELFYCRMPHSYFYIYFANIFVVFYADICCL